MMMKESVKHHIKRALCLVLCGVMLLLFGCGPNGSKGPASFVFDDGIVENAGNEQTEVKEPESYSYLQDFENTITGSDPDWTVNAEGTQGGGVFTSKTNHAYLALKQKVKADVYTAEFDVETDRDGNIANTAAFIGLRLPAYDDQFAAVGPNGIWVVFHCNQVGIITIWPSVSVFKCEADFRDMQHVVVTDDVVNNVITVETEKDGVKTLIMTVTITENKKVTVTNSAGKKRAKATLDHELDTTGYVAFWATGGSAGKTIMDNAKVSWTEALPEQYVPVADTELRDLYADTWVMADDLCRDVTDSVAAPRDKMVGMFYQIWFTPTSVTYPDQIIYNHYEIYQKKGIDALKQAYISGPEGWGHYWGEPYFGYYLSFDRWVIRKHASMLADMGIDFIYLDTTNGNPMTTSYKAVLKEYAMMRSEGLETPKICFFISGEVGALDKVLLDIWDNVYKDNRYSDLYQYYDGKPLILSANFSNASEESKVILENFTCRRCWALHENVGDGADFWTWMCESPQVASYNTSKNNEIEEMSISAGILANTSTGRSFHNGKQPDTITLADGTRDDFQFNSPTMGEGLLFAEQMERVSEVDPYVVLVTEWNEWIAGRWEGFNCPTIAATHVSWSQSFYVDCFNPEFSRDIEPMKGGFGDNYYYQLAAFLRAFKGNRSAPAADGQHEITLNGGLDQWKDVWPEYCDPSGDTLHRDSLGYGGFNHYVNNSGRNDIVSAKVSRSGGQSWFLAACADTITEAEGTNWMNLYIDTDCNRTTGWYGYDILVNRNNGSIEKFVDCQWKFETVGTAELYTEGNYIVLKLDDQVCGLGSDFNFKWADNSTENGSIMEFLDLGDVAPNARFNYAYRASAKEVKLNDRVKSAVSDGASFTVGRPYMLSDGKALQVYAADTSVTAEMYKGRVFVPAASLGQIKDMTAEVSADGTSVEVKYKKLTFIFKNGETDVACGADTYKIPVAPYVGENGVLYVPLNAAAYICGLNYAQNDAGTAIITKAKLPKDEALTQVLAELHESY